MRQLFLKVLNYMFFYVGWVLSLQQASLGKPYLAPAIVAAILVIHLFTVRKVLAEVLIIASIALIGTFIDTLYLLAGAIHYQAGYQTAPWLAPLWLTGIWALYAMCLNYSLSWLKGHDLIAGVLGGSCTAICYSAAERVGAIEIIAPRVLLLTFIGVIWFFLFPLSLRYSYWVLIKFTSESGSRPLPG